MLGPHAEHVEHGGEDEEDAEDAGEDDVLVGATGTDWFFRAVDDVITDLFAGEILDLL